MAYRLAKLGLFNQAPERAPLLDDRVISPRSIKCVPSYLRIARGWALCVEIAVSYRLFSRFLHRSAFSLPERGKESTNLVDIKAYIWSGEGEVISLSVAFSSALTWYRS